MLIGEPKWFIGNLLRTGLLVSDFQMLIHLIDIPPSHCYTAS